MTSSRAGQGESWVTEHKMRGLRGTFTINLTICAQSRNLNWRPYHHFDLHAGCGWNRKYEVPGSPLAFLDAAEESGHPRVIAHFVEIDAARAAELLRSCRRQWCAVSADTRPDPAARRPTGHGGRNDPDRPQRADRGAV
jgi:hypothetical protein